MEDESDYEVTRVWWGVECACCCDVFAKMTVSLVPPYSSEINKAFESCVGVYKRWHGLVRVGRSISCRSHAEDSTGPLLAVIMQSLVAAGGQTSAVSWKDYTNLIECSSIFD